VGQLGNSSNIDSHVPVSVPGLARDVRAISGGSSHFCALATGGVECWGYNANGQLGDDTPHDRYAPVPVHGLTSGVLAISAGGAHTCALVNDGVQCWGYNAYGQLGNDSTHDSYVPAPVVFQVGPASSPSIGHGATLTDGAAP
jgi:alpha-tubulin suppressor-like RCC1 family protein